MKVNPHTTSPNVRVMDSAFFMPELNRTRRIWLYLPEGYATSGKRYPVLYMHDGQNLFDAATSFAGEWEVDESLDALQAACIVVGIDNAGTKRINEYTMNDHPEHGKAEGKQYLDFIVHTLKPYIDKHYRTKRGKPSTFMAGSSMGGLITFYAGILYPSVFGKLGVFSPAFWIAPRIGTEIEQLARSRAYHTQQYYFYAGRREGPGTVNNMMQVYDQLRSRTRAKGDAVVWPEGQHNEATWAKVFTGFYEWMKL